MSVNVQLSDLCLSLSFASPSSLVGMDVISLIEWNPFRTTKGGENLKLSTVLLSIKLLMDWDQMRFIKGRLLNSEGGQQ